MACGVALKRSLDFDLIHNATPSVSCNDTISTPSAKRRRYSIPHRCGAVTSVTNTPPSVSPSVWRRYASTTNESGLEDSQSPFATASKSASFSSEQIVNHIYQEYKRLKKRKQLVGSKFSASDSANMEGFQPNQSQSEQAVFPQLPLIHLDPKNSSSVILPPEKQRLDAPLLSIKQVGLICERLLKEQQERLCSEYEKALVEKLSEQYDAFVKFSHDQLHQQLQGRPASYVS